MLNNINAVISHLKPKPKTKSTRLSFVHYAVMLVNPVRSWHGADSLACEPRQESSLSVGFDLFNKATNRLNYESTSFTIANASDHVVFSSMCFLISTRLDTIIDGQRFFQERYACQEYPI